MTDLLIEPAIEPGMEFRSISLNDFEVRLDGDVGTFSGYACRWDVEDSYGTRFAPRSWSAGGLDGNLYAYLDMHDPTVRIGTFNATEDDTGLLITGKFLDTTRGRDAREEARSGAAAELSVGFVRTGVDPDDANYITGARLVEVSQITARMGSQQGAALTAIRMVQPDQTEERAKARCVECKRFISKPLCKRCQASATKRADGIEIETRAMYEPPEGSYEAIIEDVQEAIQEWAESYYSGDGMTTTYVYVQINATFPDSVVATCFSDTIEDSDGESWRFPYVRSGEDNVTLGTPEPVEMQVSVVPDQEPRSDDTKVETPEQPVNPEQAAAEGAQGDTYSGVEGEADPTELAKEEEKRAAHQRRLRQLALVKLQAVS